MNWVYTAKWLIVSGQEVRLNRLVGPLVGDGAAGPVGRWRDLPIGAVTHSVARMIATMAAARKEFGERRALDGLEGTNRIERFGEEFHRAEVIASDEPAQSFIIM